MARLGMPQKMRPLSRMPRIRPLSRREWISASVVAVLILAYVISLKLLDHRAEAYFRETRETNPELYLEQLRDLHGFMAFLPEYAAMNGFEDYTERTPEFLIGRWTMREAPVRLPSGERPDQCSDPITFDYGIVLMVEPEGTTLPVQYRVKGDIVEMHVLQGAAIPLTLVSFGALVDHIEFVPPGRSDMVYAYFCGR